jgi:hypothetical protein
MCNFLRPRLFERLLFQNNVRGCFVIHSIIGIAFLKALQAETDNGDRFLFYLVPWSVIYFRLKTDIIVILYKDDTELNYRTL